tara:strand:- start:5007 stop:5180 length:174 start_codon:yes stop_codon:yes gene_type:complete
MSKKIKESEQRAHFDTFLKDKLTPQERNLFERFRILAKTKEPIINGIRKIVNEIIKE